MPTTYDVALSFAGDDRPVARAIAESLIKEKISVFFDEYASAELWGEDLYQHLNKVYEDTSLCIVIISKSYSKSKWTHNELRNLLAHSINRPSFAILPIYLVGASMPNDLLKLVGGTIGYIEWPSVTSEEIAHMVKDRLATLPPKETKDKYENYHVIKRETGWSVKRGGASRAASVHKTREEAINAAREHARRNKPAVIVVHSADGSIESQETFLVE